MQYGQFQLAAGGVTEFAGEHVDESWDPVVVGNEDTIADLVSQAQQRGVIQAPTGAQLSFEYSADADGGGYQYHVILERTLADDTKRSITLASAWSGMVNVVSLAGEVKGTPAVTAILEGAVAEANAVLGDFAAFAEPTIQVLHSRDPDSACDVELYVDGEPFKGKAEVEDMDPGRGYEEEDYRENLREAWLTARRPGSRQFDLDILERYQSFERPYRKWSTGQWQEPEDNGDLDIPPGFSTRGLDEEEMTGFLGKGLVRIGIKIENTYELYDDVTTYGVVEVTTPPDPDGEAYDDWRDDNIKVWTGVGHTDGDSWYDVTVTHSSHPDVIPVGTTWDWGY